MGQVGQVGQLGQVCQVGQVGQVGKLSLAMQETSIELQSGRTLKEELYRMTDTPVPHVIMNDSIYDVQTQMTDQTSVV